jgi:hypothetical protein
MWKQLSRVLIGGVVGLAIGYDYGKSSAEARSSAAAAEARSAPMSSLRFKETKSPGQRSNFQIM